MIAQHQPCTTRRKVGYLGVSTNLFDFSQSWDLGLAQAGFFVYGCHAADGEVAPRNKASSLAHRRDGSPRRRRGCEI